MNKFFIGYIQYENLEGNYTNDEVTSKCRNLLTAAICNCIYY